MIKKTYSKNGKTCRVTFVVPPGSDTEQVYLCGDFTEWEKTCVPMKKRKDGSFSSSVTLPIGKEYYFRYRFDEGRWENDEAADRYAPNPFGSYDGVIQI